ncbi:hypothetical protein CRG98_039416, partial [Punica granatum]
QSRPFRPPVKPRSEPASLGRRSEHSHAPFRAVVAAPNGRNRRSQPLGAARVIVRLPLTGFGPLRFIAGAARQPSQPSPSAAA